MSHADGRPPEEAPRYARLAARVLAPARRLESDAPAPGERETTIVALADALVRRPRPVVRRLVVGLGTAAVVVLAAGLVLLSLDRAGRVTARLDGGPSLAAGAQVRADAEHAVSLSLSTGTQLRLSDRGRMTIAELGQRQSFVLDEGRLSAKVSHLARDHRFVITTPDAEIEVRGTTFEVVVAPQRPGCGTGLTRVVVTEGLVTVRRGNDLWQVAGGQAWPEACPVAAQAVSPSGSADAVREATGPAVVRSVAGGRGPAAANPVPRRQKSRAVHPRPGAQSTASDLREQNDLFAAAVNARRRGDVGEVRRALDELLTRFPFGALADSARGELAALRKPAPGVADPLP